MSYFFTMKKTNHISLEQLAMNIDDVSKVIPLWSLWFHYKNSEKRYRIVDLVIDEASDEVSVVYQGVGGIEIKFVRLAKIFLEKVMIDGEEVGRFETRESNEKL